MGIMCLRIWLAAAFCCTLSAVAETNVAESLVTLMGDRVLVPGVSNDLMVKVVNPFAQPAQCDLSVGGWSFDLSLNAESDKNVHFRLELPESVELGKNTLTAKVKLTTANGSTLYSGKTELPYQAALPVGSPKKIRPIVLDSRESVTELADDTAPQWNGAKDLSAEFRLSHDKGNLLVEATVRDQDHSTPYDDGLNNWMNDSVELGIINAAGERFEFIVSGTPGDDTLFWCKLSPYNHSIGAQILPLSVRSDGDLTKYSFQIPLQQINVSETRGTRFRISLIANDNDGGRRVRLMHFGGGADGKEGSKFEWCVIQ